MKLWDKFGQGDPIEVPNKVFLVAAIPLAILFILLFILFRTQDATEHFKSTVIHRHFQGSVVEKFEDRNNRGMKTIKYRASNGYSYEMGADSWVGLWEDAELGDSLYKLSGDSFLHLIQRRGASQTLKLPFNFEHAGSTVVKRFQ